MMEHVPNRRIHDNAARWQLLFLRAALRTISSSERGQSLAPGDLRQHSLARLVIADEAGFLSHRQ